MVQFRIQALELARGHPLAIAVIAVGAHPVAAQEFRQEAFRVGQVGDGLAHVLRLGDAQIAGKGEEAIAGAQIVGGIERGTLLTKERNAIGNDVARGHLVDDIDLAALQLLKQRVVVDLFEDDAVDGGLAAFEVAQVVLVDLERRHMRLFVIGNEAVGAGGQLGVIEVSGLLIEYALAKDVHELRRFGLCRIGSLIFLFLSGGVAQIRAFAVVRDLKSGRDDRYRIGRHADEQRLVEIRQIFAGDRQREAMLVQQPYAREHVRFAGGIGLIADKLAHAAGNAAEFVDLGGRLQKHGKHEVRRRDGRSIVVDKVRVDFKRIGLVAAGEVLREASFVDDRRVDFIGAVATDGNGGVSVEQGAHVDVGGVVAPHVGKEEAAHLVGGSHGDLDGFRSGLFRRGLFRHRRHAHQKQRQRQKQRYEPLVHALHLRIVSCFQNRLKSGRRAMHAHRTIVVNLTRSNRQRSGHPGLRPSEPQDPESRSRSAARSRQ